MTVSRLGSVAAVLGGLVWILVAALAWGDEDPGGVLYLVGYALLLVAGAAMGYSLVAKAPVWLRAVVTVANAALGAMLWLILDDSLSPGSLALLVGGVLLLVGGGIGLSRSSGPGSTDRPPPPPPPARGRRAAR
jgi:hypothetical protein